MSASRHIKSSTVDIRTSTRVDTSPALSISTLTSKFSKSWWKIQVEARPTATNVTFSCSIASSRRSVDQSCKFIKVALTWLNVATYTFSLCFAFLSSDHASLEITTVRSTRIPICTIQRFTSFTAATRSFSRTTRNSASHVNIGRWSIHSTAMITSISVQRQRHGMAMSVRLPNSPSRDQDWCCKSEEKIDIFLCVCVWLFDEFLNVWSEIFTICKQKIYFL